ncbi:MAG: uracil-DNA glycosylase, partial [Candidatus Aenigmarchaeota archaeon]|nr:uracil-DNA glycosylase [Candidatus Aenigmarchaeota archaeon]
MDKQKELDKIANEIVKCQKCPLGQQRTKAVSGEGYPNAQIMFVGEAPGKQEDLQGKPFVGTAGKLLDELILLIGLKRKDIFITNIVKCRPPANRDPLPQEIDFCLPYLERQIEIIQPKLIVTLGRHAMYQFLPDRFKISQVHGQPKKMINSKTGVSQVYYPVYHPA